MEGNIDMLNLSPECVVCDFDPTVEPFVSETVPIISMANHLNCTMQEPNSFDGNKVGDLQPDSGDLYHSKPTIVKCKQMIVSVPINPRTLTYQAMMFTALEKLKTARIIMTMILVSVELLIVRITIFV